MPFSCLALGGDQVKIAMLAKDASLRSVLALALASKNKVMFGAARDAVESALTPDEVSECVESS